jgi:hypothetical protein
MILRKKDNYERLRLDVSMQKKNTNGFFFKGNHDDDDDRWRMAAVNGIL